MPYDPMTGQDLPYSNSYSSQGMQTPLIMDVVDNYPGMMAMMAVGQRRGANTIMRGGFLDRESKLSRLNPITRDNRQAFGFKRNDALRRFRGNNLTDISSGGRFTRGSYVGPLGLRKQRAAKMMAQMSGETLDVASGAASRFGGKYAQKLQGLRPSGKGSAPFLRPSIANNLSLRSRFHSVSVFGAAEGRGLYTPFQGAAAIGGILGKNEKFLKTFGHGLTLSDVEGQQVASGGLFSMMRASGEMDTLERKIAKRTAAGKSTTGLEKRLTKAQQSVSRIGSITREGFDFFNTAETTLDDLQKKQVALRPGQKGATGGQRIPRRAGRNAKGRFVSNATYSPVSRPYFGTATTDRLPGSSKVNILRGKGGGYSAQITLPSGQTQQRFIGKEIGAQYFGGGVGYSGNLLASTAGGPLTQSMMGYMRGAQGYTRAGGLSGHALRAANVAVDDAAKVVEQMSGKGVSFRAGSGVQSADDLISAVRSGARDLYGTVDDVLAAQDRVAKAKGNVGPRAKTVDDFGLNKQGKSLQRKTRSGRFKPGALDPGIVATGDDIVRIGSRSNLGLSIGSATNPNLVVQNTAMPEGFANRTVLTKDVSDDLVKSLTRREVGESFLEKGFFRTYGVSGTMQAFKESAEARKLMLNRSMTGAMRFANPILTASAVYDISKMAATAIIGGGARLARDAVKSMQGSINKPSFGMGFVDNEVAATSRARGVMAIQNSRLNARSALGSEGAMMAARFG